LAKRNEKAGRRSIQIDAENYPLPAHNGEKSFHPDNSARWSFPFFEDKPMSNAAISIREFSPRARSTHPIPRKKRHF
jgi:hypothetical protein